MNKDGVFKIGDILHSYERNYIAVSDGDLNKLKIAKNNPEKYAGMQGENNVYVEQYSNLKSDFYNNFRSKDTYYEWINDAGEYKLTIRLECISRLMYDYTYKTLPYIWVKGEKERSWGSGYKRIKSRYEVESFRAQITYPEDPYYDADQGHMMHWVRHNIEEQNLNARTSDSKRYGSFVFDEHIRTVKYVDNLFDLPDLNAIYLDADVKGDHWDTEDCVYGSQTWATYNPCQGVYPVWHINN
jgi:hypothetical protein